MSRILLKDDLLQDSILLVHVGPEQTSWAICSVPGTGEGDTLELLLFQASR